MAKNYILKNEITSPAKIQRLLKTIDTNAKDDRKEAQDLLSKVKEALSQLTENLQMDAESGMQSADAFTKLIQSATLALNQAGIANERLLKLAMLLQKFEADKTKQGGKTAQLSGSLFSNIERLANQKSDDDD